MNPNWYAENYGDVEIEIYRIDESEQWRWYINSFFIDAFGQEKRQCHQKSLNGYSSFATALHKAREFMAKYFAEHHNKQEWSKNDDSTIQR